MKLYDLLLKTISKMPNGWGETIEVNLSSWWTAPCDGLLTLKATGKGDVAYVSNGKDDTFIAVCTVAGGRSTSSNIARKGETYRIGHKGANILSITVHFTPFSYRGGCLYRLVKFLQSLTFKGVTA